HCRRDVVDITGGSTEPARLSPGTEGALATLGSEEVVEVSGRGLRGLLHPLDRRLELVNLLHRWLEVHGVRGGFHGRQSGGNRGDSDNRLRAGVERTPCLSGGVLEAHEPLLRLAGAVVNYAEGALHLVSATSAKRYCIERIRGRPAELNQGILGIRPLEVYSLEESSHGGQANVDGTLDLAEPEGDQSNDESRIL